MRRRRPTEELNHLYEEIFRCDKCIGAEGCLIQPDSERVRREVIPRALDSEVFVVGQALASRTQRRSGIPYYMRDGSLSDSGQKFDAFLQNFGYTIDPVSELNYVYSSDVIQHYPGRGSRGDRKPTRPEADNCAEWLGKELALVSPKVVILLGEVAPKGFLRRYGARPISKMKDAWGKPHQCAIDGHPVSAVPVQHPAYRFGDRNQIDMIYRNVAAYISALLQKRR